MKAFSKRGFTGYLLLLLLSLAIAITGACGLKGPMISKNNIPADIDADVKKEIERLYSSAAMERKNGANILGSIGKRAAPAVPFLIDMLKDEDMFVRRSVAKALGKIGDPRAVEPLLITVLKDKDVTLLPLRLGAVSALGNIKDPRAVDALIAVLPLIAKYSAGEKFIGKEAAKALGKIGDPRAIEPLIAALKDEEKGVKGQAVMGYVGEGLALLTGQIPVGYMPGTATKRSTDMLTDIKRRDRGELWSVAWAIADIGKPAVEPLLAALKNKDIDEDIRRRAPVALGRIGDPRAVEPLIAALKDKDEDVKFSAVSALGKIGDSRAVEPLLAALKDKDAAIRLGVVSALGNIKDSRVIEPLIATLMDNDKNVQLNTVLVLGKIGDSRAVEPLIAVLKDKDKDLRWGAVEALVNIKDPRATVPLVSTLKELTVAMKNEHWTVRKNAAEMLGRIGQLAVEPLIIFLKDDDNEVRLSAAEALGNIKDPRAVEPLIDILKGEPMMAWIGDKLRLDVRGVAAIALGKIGDHRAVEPLIAALKYKDANVRKSAAEALGKVTGKYFGEEPAKWQAWWAESKNRQSASPEQPRYEVDKK